MMNVYTILPDHTSALRIQNVRVTISYRETVNVGRNMVIPLFGRRFLIYRMKYYDFNKKQLMNKRP